FSSRRRHTRFSHDWSSDVCSSDLEIIGRHTRYFDGTLFLIELEIGGVGPTIHTIMGNIERDISDQVNLFLMTIAHQLFPLAEKQKLNDFFSFYVLRQLLPQYF